MQRQIQVSKGNLRFIASRGVAEAVDENPGSVLSLDYRAPDQVVAFISPEFHNEVTRQFAKNSDLDGVCVRTSLRGLIQEGCDYLEDDRALDSWVRSLQEAITQLRNFQRERESALNASCNTCAHQAREHYRPHLGDIQCRHDGCGCPEFSPLTAVQSKREESLQPRSILGIRGSSSRT